MTEKTAILICGRKAGDENSAKEFHSLAHLVGQKLPNFDVVGSLFGGTDQSLEADIAGLVARGAKKIVCLPGDLPTAHSDLWDLASEINGTAAHFPDITFIQSHDLAADGKILSAARDRIEACEKTASAEIPREETLLMVVGHGSENADANAKAAKVARMLWEGMGFGWAEVSYADHAFPSVDTGLAHAVKLGFRRVIVFPYFLFSEVALDNIKDQTQSAASAHPAIDFQSAPHLNDHHQVVDCFIDRIGEALNGSNTMNCMKCIYREQVTDHDDDHDHAHQHSHDHGHGHDHTTDKDHAHSHSPSKGE